MNDRVRWAIRIAALIGAALALVLIYQLRTLLLLILLAFVLAYVLDPPVTRLARLVGGRGRGIICVGAALALLLTAALAALGPRVAAELRWAAATLPGKAAEAYAQVVPRLQATVGIQLPATLPEAARELWGLRGGWGPWLTQRAQAMVAAAASSVVGLVTTVLDLLIIPMFWVFFLQEGPEVKARLLRRLSGAQRAWLERVTSGMDGALRQFLRGQATVCAVVAVLLGVGLALVGMKLAIVMAVASGLATFIPYIGPMLSTVTAVLLAFLEFGDVSHGLLVAAVYAGVYMLDAFVITPRVVGHRIGLHPLVVLVTVLAAGKLLGVWGILLAVPTAAILRVLIPEVWALLPQAPEQTPR
ncbi:MAG: AI-2E family transporter [candidate division NC10 bacterium]|nr:AI-2E family transporter [candidate division NC10 bacterium]